MRRQLFLLGLVLAVCLVAPSAHAVDAAAESDGDSFNAMGYVILGLALVGWTFFLGLLGGAILHIVKKSRKPYTPKHPVKCK